MAVKERCDEEFEISKPVEVKKSKSSLLGLEGFILEKQKSAFTKMGLENPYCKVSTSLNQNTLVIDGEKYSNYASYDYLGLSSHPHVFDRVASAMKQYGTSCSASRLAGGEKNLHRELEKAIAGMLKVEDSLVFVGGYTTNVSCIEHLLSSRDLVIHDALVHNSILKGCLLSGAKRHSFPHNDYAALEKLLKEKRSNYDKVLIILEGVYSMDGDIPDIKEVIRIKKTYDAALMVDEAHSAGVIGKTGRGLSEYAEIDPKDVDIWMGTLSKAFASCGGYIAGSGELIDYLRFTAPGFVYSVGISPTNTAASLGAIEVLFQEPDRVKSLQEKSEMFRKLCLEKGFNLGQSKDSAVMPIITGSSETALQLADALFKQKIHVLPLFYPAVEKNCARLRFFMTCLHTEEQIYSTIEAIERSLQKICNDKHLTPFISQDLHD
jgi:8-amino-7-oxononanoate synthase